MSLNARKPSGKVAFPLVLVEGAEKAGKTYTALSLSKSPRVGRTFVFDLGEGTADEYAELGPYEVVDHNGTFVDLLAQIKLACAEKAKNGPNVIVIDSATVLWDSLKDWAAARARNSQSNRRLLQNDPDAEINVSSTYWNDANERWGQVLHELRYWPGVGVLVARAKEVAKMGRDGNPVAGQTEYKIEAQKNLPYVVTAQVRCDSPGVTRLVAVRSLRVHVEPKGLALPKANPLDHAVFDIMGAGTEFGVSSAVEMQLDVDTSRPEPDPAPRSETSAAPACTICGGDLAGFPSKRDGKGYRHSSDEDCAKAGAA